MAAFNQGDLARAAEVFERIVDGRGLHRHLARFYAGQVRFRLGQEALRDGRYEEAVDHFRRALQTGTEGIAASRYLVACYAAMGRYGQAASELEGLLGRDDDRCGVRLRLALARWKNGQVDLAVQCLEQGIRAQPHQAALHHQLGVFLAARDEYARAAEAFERAVALEPNRVDAHLGLGWCYAALGRYDRALACLRKTQALRPTDAEIARQLHLAVAAAAQWRQGSEPQALPPVAGSSPDDIRVAQLAEMIAQDPDFVEAFLALPEADVDRTLLELLAAGIDRAIRAHPNYADLHLYGSRVYERLGLTDAAMVASQKAIEINPRYLSAMVQMARLFEATDRRQEAIDRLEAALRTGAEDADIHYVLGNLYRADGQVDRARSSYERALHLNAGLSAAREALETLAA